MRGGRGMCGDEGREKEGVGTQRMRGGRRREKDTEDEGRNLRGGDWLT